MLRYPVISDDFSIITRYDVTCISITQFIFYLRFENLLPAKVAISYIIWYIFKPQAVLLTRTRVHAPFLIEALQCSIRITASILFSFFLVFVEHG